ncbi:MAG: hypothetical protein HOH33_04395 [Verrucomicrobia bacterium]|nr:hypothetical protein [Verrucomicrobiota bacterium]
MSKLDTTKSKVIRTTFPRIREIHRPHGKTRSKATDGFHSAIFIHPVFQTAVVLLANSQVGATIGSTAYLFDTIAGSVLNVTLNAPPIEANIPTLESIEASVLQDYVGYYEPENGDVDPSFPIRVEGDKLMTEGPGEMPMRLWPTDEDVFFLRAYTSTLRFQRRESGGVSGVFMNFEG